MLPTKKLHKTLYHDTAREIADLVVAKQKAYGDSFGKSGQILKILYPEGIKPQDMNDALTIIRIVDKLFRIATQKDAFGESPWKDILGYALLASTKDRIMRVNLHTFITTPQPPLKKSLDAAFKSLALRRKRFLEARSVKKPIQASSNIKSVSNGHLNSKKG